MMTMEARVLAQSEFTNLVGRHLSVRRELALPGAQAVATLTKKVPLYGHYRLPSTPHVELKADCIDEPTTTRYVPLLEALPRQTRSIKA